MDVIYLPLLSPDASLQDAYQAMHKHLRAAVVRGSSKSYSLIRAVDIYSGLARNFTVLRRLSDKFPMHEISNLEIKRWGLDVADPFTSWREFELLLDQVNKKYAMLDFVPGLARVVTRHEDLARQFSSAPMACYCDSEDYMHPYPPPSVSSGDTCHCGFKISCY